MKTRTYLLLMLIAIIVPVAALSTMGLSMLLKFERESRIRSIQELANSTSLLIDTEIAKAEASIRVMANSREIRSGAFEDLYRLARATQASPLSWTLIADYEGSGVINTLRPYGTPLAKNTGPWAARIIDGQKTEVGGYFIGNSSKRGVVSVNVPVPAETGRKYVVTQIFDPNYFNKVFDQRAIKPTWIVGISDANGISIARNVNAAQFVGTPVRPELREASRTGISGVVKHRTREGIEVYNMFVRSQLTNWTLAIGVPVEEIESAARLITWYVALALLTVLGGAVGMAFFFARRIDRALNDATAAAHAVARGTVAPVSRSGLKEADVLLKALHRSSLALTQESEARAALEHERELLLEKERADRMRAEAQDHAKDNFLSMLSHELRNPLAAITNAVALLRHPAAHGASLERAWDVIVRQLAHLTRMLDDLLDVRRVLTGRIELRKTRLDAGELVQFCCDSRRLGDTKQHEWTVLVTEAWTLADRVRLTQAIDNLLTNAIKFTPEGGSIAVRCYTDKQTVMIEVADTGVGIAAGVLPTIFDSLIQGPTAIDRSSGGLGIGLTIARALVQMHGGAIAAHSAGIGCGSTFTVQLSADGSAALPD